MAFSAATIELDDATVNRALDMLQDKIGDVAGVGLVDWAMLVMRDCKAHYVPVDTGFLRSTGFVTSPMLGNGVAFGFSARYAAAVHERESHGNPFLTMAIQDHIPDADATIGNAITSSFRGLPGTLIAKLKSFGDTDLIKGD